MNELLEVFRNRMVVLSRCTTMFSVPRAELRGGFVVTSSTAGVRQRVLRRLHLLLHSGSLEDKSFSDIEAGEWGWRC